MTQSINLFQKYRFKMHSGGYSDFKLECDAITKEDYETLAFLVSRKMNFCKCYGIPSGGIPFEKALSQYEDKNSSNILIADDVLTTGKSFIDFKNHLIEKNLAKEENIIGVTVFARGPVLNFVTPIFTLNESFWQND